MVPKPKVGHVGNASRLLGVPNRSTISTEKAFASTLKPSSISTGRRSRTTSIVWSSIMPKIDRNATINVNGKAPTIDVAGVCIDPMFRSNSVVEQEEELNASRTKARVLFLSEGNVCRSLLAEAILKKMLWENGLADVVECESRGTRDYNLDEGPEASALIVAKEFGLTLREGTALVFDHTKEIVQFDMLLAVDKFTLADAMREVSVYDTVDSTRKFCGRIRHIGEFGRGKLINDVDDPLYNGGSGDEVEAVRKAATQMHDCCKGLVRLLLEIREIDGEDASVRQGLSDHLKGLKEVEWLKPPMLGGGTKNKGSASETDVDFV